jgi:hypothetical protein
MTEKTYLYANNAVVGVSQFEATLIFQRMSLPPGVTPQPGTLQVSIAEEVDVLVSFAHLKSLAASILSTIHEYERAQGRPIQMPKELEARFDDALKLFTTPAVRAPATRQ